MEKLWIMLVIGIAFGITNTIMKHFTGIKPTGWRFFLYDAPAFVAGILMGHFLL